MATTATPQCNLVILSASAEIKTSDQSDSNNSLKQYRLDSFIRRQTEPSNHAVLGVGLHLLDCWERGFEYLLRHRYLSLVFALSCAGSWSLVRGKLPRVRSRNLDRRRPSTEPGCCKRANSSIELTAQKQNRSSTAQALRWLKEHTSLTSRPHHCSTDW
jgi:hypothetical protein